MVPIEGLLAAGTATARQRGAATFQWAPPCSGVLKSDGCREEQTLFQAENAGCEDGLLEEKTHSAETIDL